MSHGAWPAYRDSRVFRSGTALIVALLAFFHSKTHMAIVGSCMATGVALLWQSTFILRFVSREICGSLCKIKQQKFGWNGGLAVINVYDGCPWPYGDTAQH